MTRRTDRFPSAILAAALILVAVAGVRLRADDPPLAIRITSPLGRTGTPGAVRIVARVENADDAAVQGVKFFVNGTAVGQDADGPVYAVDWVDDNPFAPTVITVEVLDAKGRSATGRVDLAAFDFVEQAEVISVLVEATVHDKTGRPISGLGKAGFVLEEDGARQVLEVVRPEILPATYVMLVDSSQSIARGVGFLRDAVTRFMRYLRPDDRVLVVPFNRTIGAATGPTNDLETVLDAMLSVRPGGGTAIYDAIVNTSEMIRRREGRHVLVLLSDGYDEHSVATRDDAIHAVQTSGATAYVIGVGGVAGISMKGEGLLKSFAEATGGRAFFPYRESELPVGPRSRRVRRGDPLRADLHADQPACRRIVPGHPAGHGGPGARRARQAWLLRPEAAAGPPDARADRVDESRRAPRRDARGPGRPRGRRAADRRGLLRSHRSGVDRPGARREWQHAPFGRGVKAAARSFVDALRKKDRLGAAALLRRGELAHDLTQFRSDAMKAIDDYTSHGGTALYDARSTSRTAGCGRRKGAA